MRAGHNAAIHNQACETRTPGHMLDQWASKKINYYFGGKFEDVRLSILRPIMSIFRCIIEDYLWLFVWCCKHDIPERLL